MNYEYVHGDWYRVVGSDAETTYLAAPFFNVPQLELVKAIEVEFEKAHRLCFSPRLQHGNTPVKIATEEQAQEVFTANERALDECSHLVAVADYKLPADTHLGIVKSDSDGVQGSINPISLPDTGTVWELGYARANPRITSVLFTEQEPADAKLNLMLTQSCAGILYGMKNLRTWIEMGMLRYGLPQWKGGFV